MLEDDFAHSYEMSMDDINQRSFWFKLGVRLARLTSPIQWGSQYSLYQPET